jgi:hypothetical protein
MLFHDEEIAPDDTVQFSELRDMLDEDKLFKLTPLEFEL